MKKITLLLCIFLITYICINYAGKGILFSEKIIYSNEEYPVSVQAEHGLRNNSTNPVLVCKYLTGLNWRYRVYWQSNNGILGLINCPNFVDVPR